MPPVRVKGIKRYKDPKTGNVYCYHRASSRRIHAEFGTAAFFTELERAEAAWRAKKPVNGTFGFLVDEYQRAPEYLRLAPRTRSDYQKVFAFLQPIRPMPVTKLDSAFVTGLRNKAYAKHKRRFANYVVQVLSRVCKIGMGLGLMHSNPAASVEEIRKATGERSLNRPWTHEERDAVLSEAPAHLAGPIALSRYLGVRLGDMVRMKRTALHDCEISFKTGKSDTEVAVPVPAALARALVALPAHKSDHLFVNSHGEPWTVHGFSSSFRKHVAKLQAKGRVGAGLTFHGLRHSVATDMREAGYTNRQIADVLGQKTETVVGVYSRKADMRRSNRKVVTEFYGDENG